MNTELKSKRTGLKNMVEDNSLAATLTKVNRWPAISDHTIKMNIEKSGI